jgi:pimeloyl-ACP methyl ester carboxylesterase
MNDPLTEQFRAVEQRLLQRHGLQIREHTLALSRPAVSARVASAGDGPPTLYVHGGGGFGGLWAPLLGRLGGRRHLVPDRPGFVLTPWVDLEGESLRAQAVGFLRGVLDGLQVDRADVVANSMGGLWSLWLALDAPERVRSLALLGAPALTGGGSAPLPMRLLGVPGVGRAMMALEPPSARQVRTLWRRMGTDPDRLDPTMLDAMLAAQRVPGYGRAWRGLLHRVCSAGGPRRDCTLTLEELAAVRCPSLVVWGRTDPFGDTAMGERIAASLRAPFVAVDGGHLPWLDGTDACAGAVAGFLKAAAPGLAGVA